MYSSVASYLRLPSRNPEQCAPVNVLSKTGSSVSSARLCKKGAELNSTSQTCRSWSRGAVEYFLFVDVGVAQSPWPARRPAKSTCVVGFRRFRPLSWQRSIQGFRRSPPGCCPEQPRQNSCITTVLEVQPPPAPPNDSATAARNKTTATRPMQQNRQRMTARQRTTSLTFGAFPAVSWWKIVHIAVLVEEPHVGITLTLSQDCGTLSMYQLPNCVMNDTMQTMASIDGIPTNSFSPEEYANRLVFKLKLPCLESTQSARWSLHPRGHHPLRGIRPPDGRVCQSNKHSSSRLEEDFT